MNSQPSQIDFTKTYLKAKTIAQVLGISRSKAYQILNSGMIPTVRFGSTVRVHPDDLQEFLNKSKQDILKDTVEE